MDASVYKDSDFVEVTIANPGKSWGQGSLRQLDQELREVYFRL